MPLLQPFCVFCGPSWKQHSSRTKCLMWDYFVVLWWIWCKYSSTFIWRYSSSIITLRIYLVNYLFCWIRGLMRVIYDRNWCIQTILWYGSLLIKSGYIQDVISITYQLNTDAYFLVNICGFYFFIQNNRFHWWEWGCKALFILVLQLYVQINLDGSGYFTIFFENKICVLH